MGSQIYDAAGGGNFTALVTGDHVITLIGAGGSGAGGSTATNGIGGGGGGGGACCIKTISLTATTEYAYVVGAGGGARVQGEDGLAGTASTFIVGATTYSAGGGQGGHIIADLLGGAGGTAANGDTNNTGGAGGAGATSGGGGGAAGTTGAGNAGVATVAGAYKSLLGGSGGAGKTGNNLTGDAPSGDAGLGWGGGSGGGTGKTGDAPAGADGYILITWEDAGGQDYPINLTVNLTVASSINKASAFQRTTTSALSVATSLSRVVGWVRNAVANLVASVTVSVTQDWLSGWSKRVKITIDNTDIDATLTWFPVLLKLGTSVGRNSDDVSFVFDELTDDANRKKIAVTKADGVTQLYVEIEKWDDANEVAWLWVSRDGWEIASDADTDVYLYFDSTHADNDTYVGDPNSVPAENVWDGNFKFASHMRDDPDTSHIRDSSTSDNDGTKLGAGEPAITTSGAVGEAQSFDGANDYISGTNIVDLDAQDVTLEAWVYFANFTKVNPRIIEVRDGDYSVQIIRDGASTRWVTKHSKWETVITGRQYSIPAVTTWYHIAAVFNVTAQTTTFYVDGSAVGGAANNNIGIGNQLNKYYLGIRSDLVDTSQLAGIIDEPRISSIGRPAAWIKATYETGRDNLLDWGSEETSGVTDYPINLTVGLTASATLDRDFDCTRVMSPALAASVTIARALTYTRDTTSNLTVATTITKAFGRVITTVANLAVSATVSRAVTFGRTVNSNLTAAVSVVKGWGRTITTSTALAVSATINRIAGKTITTTTGLTAAVSIAKSRGWSITTSTALAVSATIARALTFTRTVAANLTASVTVAVSRGWAIVTSSALAVSTTISRTMTYARATTSNLTAAATIAKSWGRTITTTAGLTASVTISRTVAFARTVATGLTTAISIVATYAGGVAEHYLVTIVANLSVSTTVTRVVAYNRTVTTALSTAAQIVKGWGRTITTSAGLTVAVSVVRTLGHYIAIATNLAISATITRTAAYARAVQAALSVVVAIVIAATGHSLKVMVISCRNRTVRSIGSMYRNLITRT